MTSFPERNEEENLEILEFYIDLLKEKVENFKKNKVLQNQKLNKFMAEYIDLEDKILNILKNISITDPNNENKMEDLTDIFTIYWSNFQDEWEDDMWSVYYMYRNLNDKDGNSEVNKNNFASSNTPELNIEELTKSLSKEESTVLKNSFMNNKNASVKKNSKANFETLNKIDADIDNIAEISVQQIREEKKRDCVDFQCTIY
jgi:hypothetical protein